MSAKQRWLSDTIDWSSVISTTLHNRSSRNAFPYPPGLEYLIWSAVHDHDELEAIDIIESMIAAVEANLNGLFIDGGGI